MNLTFYEAMQEVLQTSRYDWLTGRRVNVMDSMIDRFFRFLDRLFSNMNFDANIPQFGYNVNALSFVFIVVGAILLIVAAIFITRMLLNRRGKEYYDLSDIFEELANKNYSVKDLIGLSNTASDRRLAIRYRYIAVILHLNEEHIIEIKPSATNATILEHIKESKPSLYPMFESTADTFHRGWFGYKNINDANYENFASMVDSILGTGGDVIA